MQKNSIIFFGLSIFFLLISFQVMAGGGRFDLESLNSPGIVGSYPINVQAWLLKTNYREASIGEKAEFIISNPRSGDKCITTNGTADQYGIIYGECQATEPGEMLVYVHSLDNNDDSSNMVLYFKSAPTSLPTSIITTPSAVTPTTQPPKIYPTVFKEKEKTKISFIDFIANSFKNIQKLWMKLIH